jgi:hypothetical protein
MNGWILPFGGSSAVEGLLSTGPTPSSLKNNGAIINGFLEGIMRLYENQS